MSPASNHKDTIRTGTIAAGAAGLVASVIVVFLVTDDFTRSRFSLVMSLSAMVCASLTTTLFWRWLAPTRSGFSLWRASIAGALSAIASSFLMWPPVFLFALEPLKERLAETSEMGLVGPGILYLSFLTLIFTGWLTVPLGIVAAGLVTVWARRRIGLT